MYIIIYIHNKPVYLCDRLDSKLEQLHHRPDTIFIDELGTHSIKAMLREIAPPEIHCGIFLHPDLEALKKAFFKKFEKHVAAGGLVLNDRKEILMIFRRGFWDLPKGHIDEGETLEACAIREVQEETGIQALEIIKPLTITYHTYEQGAHHILKESHWYLMSTPADSQLIPQTEEDIEQIEWVASEKLEAYIAKAYPSIRNVIQGYIENHTSQP